MKPPGQTLLMPKYIATPVYGKVCNDEIHEPRSINWNLEEMKITVLKFLYKKIVNFKANICNQNSDHTVSKIPFFLVIL